MEAGDEGMIYFQLMLHPPSPQKLPLYRRFIAAMMTFSIVVFSHFLFAQTTHDGPLAMLTQAVTDDANGNGYLDRIILHFDQEVTFPISDDAKNLAGIKFNSFTFSVDSISGASNRSTTDSVFIMYLHELENNIPQTAWTPIISITGITGIAPITNLRCVDGAGPVIWSVVKEIDTLENRSDDKVTVTLSERILSSDGSSFGLMHEPAQIFNAWKRAASSTMVRDTGMLGGIRAFYSTDNDSAVSFYMKNGNDLSRSYLLSIKTDPSLIIDWLTGNAPSNNNQIVQVKLSVSDMATTGIKIGGNNNITTSREIMNIGRPGAIIIPSSLHVQPGVFQAQHSPYACDWVKHDGAGCLIRIPILVPADSLQKVTLDIGIYDQNGNLIQQGMNTDVLASITSNDLPTCFLLDIYWNGYDNAGKPMSTTEDQIDVKVTLNYSDPNIKEMVFKSNSSITPGSPSHKSGCGCGSGTGLAFIPPIGFKVRSWWQRKKKNKAALCERK
jgi:hypothetical protein